MDFLHKVVGLPCVEMRLGYANTLIVGFGSLVEYTHPKMAGKFHGEWQLREKCSRWRIVLDNRVIAGDHDNDLSIDKEFQKLIGKTLSSFTGGTLPGDIVISFENGYRLELFCTDKNHKPWELLGPEHNYTPSKNDIFEIVISDEIDIQTTEERLQSLHAEECHKRWSRKVPVSGNQKCSACVFYEQLESASTFMTMECVQMNELSGWRNSSCK